MVETVPDAPPTAAAASAAPPAEPAAQPVESVVPNDTRAQEGPSMGVSSSDIFRKFNWLRNTI